MLKPGVFTLTLISSEPLIEMPYLQFKLEAKSPLFVALSNPSGDRMTWVGEIEITTATGDGLATFSWSGTDLAGNVGTEITSGATFFIDTQQPSFIANLSVVTVSVSSLSFTWTSPSDAGPTGNAADLPPEN